MYKNKVSLLKIALETGYTPAIIQRHLQEQKDWESLKTNHNKKIDDKTLEKIIEDYNNDKIKGRLNGIGVIYGRKIIWYK